MSTMQTGSLISVDEHFPVTGFTRSIAFKSELSMDVTDMELINNGSGVISGYATSVSVTSDGEYVAIANSGTPGLAIFKITGSLLTKIYEYVSSIPLAVSWSPDGQYLAFGYGDGTYFSLFKRVHDTVTKVLDFALASRCEHLAWSVDGQFILAYTATSGHITTLKKLGDTLTNVSEYTGLAVGTVNRIQFTPDGNNLAVAHSVTPYFHLLDFSQTTGVLTSNVTYTLGGNAIDLSISQDGTKIALVTEVDNRLTILDWVGGSLSLRVETSLPMNPAAVEFMLDGQNILVGYTGNPYGALYTITGVGVSKLFDRTDTAVVPRAYINIPGTTNVITISTSNVPYFNISNTVRPSVRDVKGIAYKGITPIIDIQYELSTVTNYTVLDGANDAAWSPDGIYCAVALPNAPFFHLLKRTGDSLTKVSEFLFDRAATSVSWYPDGINLIVGCVDGTVNLLQRNGDTISRVSQVTLTAGGVRKIATSPDSSNTYSAATSDSDPTLYLIKRVTNTLSITSSISTGNTGHGVAFTIDGGSVFVGTSTVPHLKAYTRSGDTLTFSLDYPQDAPVYDISISSDGEYMATASQGNSGLTIYRNIGSNSFTQITSLAIANGATCHDVSWSPNTSFLAVACDTAPFMIVYARNGNMITQVASASGLQSTGQSTVAFASDNQALMFCSSTEDAMTLIYFDTTTVFDKLSRPTNFLEVNPIEYELDYGAINFCNVNTTGFTGNASSVAMTNDLFAVGMTTSPYLTVAKRTDNSWAKLGTTAWTENVVAMAFSPDGQYLAICHSASPYFSLLKRYGDNFIMVSEYTTAGTSRCVAWSPDGEYIAVGHSNSPYFTLLKRSGDVVERVTSYTTTGACTSVAYSSDGRFIALGTSVSPRLTVLTQTGDTVSLYATSTAVAYTVNSVAFTPDTYYIALGYSSSPYITLVRRADGTLTKVSDAPSSSNTSRLTWSPDGQNLLAAHSTTPYFTSYKRSGNTLTETFDMASLAKTCTGIAISPDGKYIGLGHSTTPYCSVLKVNTMKNRAIAMEFMGFKYSRIK